MPQVQFVNMHRSIRVTRSMPTPKRVGEIRYWLKEAQKWIKEIPRQIAETETMADRSLGSDGWYVINSDVDVKWIRFNLVNRIGETAQIVIDRQAKF